ncbi:MAG: ankyrin repeat domain-containing protein [Gemmatimonadota bacterium]|nr:ankyrin repeat domain-containing protein [Gemmatimonadota bacterium]
MSIKIKQFVLVLLLLGFAGCGAPLTELSRRGDVKGVQRSLDRGSDVNARTPQGHSPLTLASREGHLEVVLALLREGADVDAVAWTVGAHTVESQDRYGGYAFIRERYTNPDSSGPQSRFMAQRTRSSAYWVLRDGKTALMLAAEAGHLDVVKALVEGGSALFATSGGEVVTPGMPSYRDYDGIVAGYTGAPPEDINREEDKHGGSYYGPEHGRVLYYDVVDSDRPSWSIGGSTALDFAYLNGHKEIIDFLLESGAGMTPSSLKHELPSPPENGTDVSNN